MSDLPEGAPARNKILSNRDRSRHRDHRGLDSKNVQTEQYQDHAGNCQALAEAVLEAEGDTSGLANPQTNESREQSRLKKQLNL